MVLICGSLSDPHLPVASSSHEAKRRANCPGSWFAFLLKALLVWPSWLLPVFGQLLLLHAVRPQLRTALVLRLVLEDLISAFCSLVVPLAEGMLEPSVVLPVQL